MNKHETTRKYEFNSSEVDIIAFSLFHLMRTQVVEKKMEFPHEYMNIEPKPDKEVEDLYYRFVK